MQNINSNLSKVWLWFIYFWLIFGVGTFVGQFIPPGIRTVLSFVLLVVILISLFIQRNRRWGKVIMNIYAFAIGIISYGAFMYYLSDLGTELFIKTVLVAIGCFAVFGILGFFLIKDASSMGKFLFIGLIAIIIASLISIFIHNTIFITVLTVLSLALFLGYTIYDFNRMRRGDFEPMEMGFNLFINLLNIIMDLLRLMSIFDDR